MTVSLWTVATVLAWITTLAVVIYSLLVGHCQWLPGPLSAVAATLSIRGFCVRLGRNVQSAFELGKDVGRSEVVEFRR